MPSPFQKKRKFPTASFLRFCCPAGFLPRSNAALSGLRAAGWWLAEAPGPAEAGLQLGPLLLEHGQRRGLRQQPAGFFQKGEKTKTSCSFLFVAKFKKETTGGERRRRSYLVRIISRVRLVFCRCSWQKQKTTGEKTVFSFEATNTGGEKRDVLPLLGCYLFHGKNTEPIRKNQSCHLFC